MWPVIHRIGSLIVVAFVVDHFEQHSLCRHKLFVSCLTSSIAVRSFRQKAKTKLVYAQVRTYTTTRPYANTLSTNPPRRRNNLYVASFRSRITGRHSSIRRTANPPARSLPMPGSTYNRQRHRNLPQSNCSTNSSFWK